LRTVLGNRTAGRLLVFLSKAASWEIGAAPKLLTGLRTFGCCTEHQSMLAARADLFCFSTLFILGNAVNMALFDDLLSLGQGQEHTIEVVNLLGRQVDLTSAGLPPPAMTVPSEWVDE